MGDSRCDVRGLPFWDGLFSEVTDLCCRLSLPNGLAEAPASAPSWIVLPCVACGRGRRGGTAAASGGGGARSSSGGSLRKVSSGSAASVLNIVMIAKRWASLTFCLFSMNSCVTWRTWYNTNG